MSIVVDFAWTKPSVSQLKSWGAVAVGMYVSHDPGKSANAAVVNSYAAAGIKTFLFFEDSANRAMAGYSAGVSDAQFAAARSAAYGKPPWAPIEVAIDFDVPDFAPNSSDPVLKLGVVSQYFKGWCDTLGKNRVGVYGGYWPVTRLIAANLATSAVQTIAWSGGKVDLKDIACLQNGHTLDNGAVDVEVINSAALLSKMAWVPGEADPGAPAPKPQPQPSGVTWASWPAATVLRFGSHGDAVRVLQTALSHSGIRGVRGISIDGAFGNQTQTSVRNFQAFKGITIDGIAGRNTRAGLVSLNDV